MNPSSDEVMEGSIIFDSNGRRIIRGGKEYPLSEEEYKALNPEHSATACKKCTFAQSKDKILEAWIGVPKNYYLGQFTMPGFTGHLPFFVFKCDNCSEFFADYPHGGGYVICTECKSSQTIHKCVRRKLWKLGYYPEDKYTIKERVMLFVLSLMFIFYMIPAMFFEFVGWLFSFFEDSKKS